MSTIAEHVYSTLSGDTALAALVADRIYPLVAPEGTARPFIAFAMISTVPNETHGAGVGERLDESIVQFTVVSDDYTGAEDVTNALRAVLENGAQPVNGSTEISNIRETYENDTELYVKQLDANFFHSA